MQFILFKSEPRKTPFAPEWEYTLAEQVLKKINFKILKLLYYNFKTTTTILKKLLYLPCGLYIGADYTRRFTVCTTVPHKY